MSWKEDTANVAVFNKDVDAHDGYVYTTSARLSSRLATDRSTEAILESGVFQGRSVLDMGCGDGFYTLRFWDRGHPRSMFGADGADRAVLAAHTRCAHRPIHFAAADAHRLPYQDDAFDVVLVQSILHHDHDPLALVREAFRLAPMILIHEPNGNNVGLKLIERVSRYHRTHNEKSYATPRVRRWVRMAGGRVIYQRFAGFVPMFCPTVLARAMKAVEPFVERTPLVNALACAVVVLVATRDT